MAVTTNLVRSTGILHYADGNLSYDALCTGGCSGGGVYVNSGGRQVAVTATSYGNRYANSGGAAVIPYEAYSGLKVQSVSADKLKQGTALFQTMPR